ANTGSAEVFQKVILSAVKDKDEDIRIAGIKALSYQDKTKALPVLFQSLNTAVSAVEYKAIEETLLRLSSAKENQLVASQLALVGENAKVVLVNVLGARDATDQFDVLLGQLNTGNENVNSAIYRALPSVAIEKNFSVLID